MPKKKISKKVVVRPKTKKKTAKPASVRGSSVAKKKSVKKIKKVVKAKAKIKKIVSKKVGNKLTKPASAGGSGVARKKLVKKTTRKPITKKTTKKISKTKNAKTAKKKLARSSSAKGSGVTRKSRKKIFVTVVEEKYFWVNNGPVLKDLRDLYNALKTINKDQFIYHAHGDNNDFALWVEYVLLDKEGAKALVKAKTQKTATKKVSEILKKYK